MCVDDLDRDLPNEHKHDTDEDKSPQTEPARSLPSTLLSTACRDQHDPATFSASRTPQDKKQK